MPEVEGAMVHTQGPLNVSKVSISWRFFSNSVLELSTYCWSLT